MTTTTSEIDDYVTAVHAALADLPDAEREDLLDDLPQHLADVRADRAGSLVELLGSPADYAAELRATAGLEATSRARSWRQSLLDGAVRADQRLGELLGYERFADLVRALAPGWWLLRGWLLAEFLTDATSRSGRSTLVPAIGGNRVAGVVLLLVAVAASVWLGRRRLRFNWQRTTVAVLGIALAVYGVGVVRHTLEPMTYYVGDSSDGSDLGDLSNIYPVGPDGSVLRNVRLYDQDGNPVQLGNLYCDGPDTGTGGGGSDGGDGGDGGDPNAPAPAASSASVTSPDGAVLFPLNCASGQQPFGVHTAPALPSSAGSSSPSESPSVSPSVSTSPSAPRSTPAATPSTSSSASPRR